MINVFPPGIHNRIELLSFLDDGPKSLTEFKEKFRDEWTVMSRYLHEALVSGLVTIRVEHRVKTRDGMAPVDLWPLGLPSNALRNIVLMISTPPEESSYTSIDESEVFFYLTEKGLSFLVEYHSKRYWKWWTLTSVVIALISLLVSVLRH